MACGTPVLCSDTTSLPEVCGPAFDPADHDSPGAVLYFDPHDVAALAERLSQAMAFKPGAIERLSARGRARAAQFTWERCATQTAALFRELAES